MATRSRQRCGIHFEVLGNDQYCLWRRGARTRKPRKGETPSESRRVRLQAISCMEEYLASTIYSDRTGKSHFSCEAERCALLFPQSPRMVNENNQTLCKGGARTGHSARVGARRE